MAEPLGETILGDREPVKDVESLVVPEYSTGEPVVADGSAAADGAGTDPVTLCMDKLGINAAIGRARRAPTRAARPIRLRWVA